MSKVVRSQRAAQQFNGREAKTATFLKRFFFSLCLSVAGFCPRHLSRSMLFGETKIATNDGRKSRTAKIMKGIFLTFIISLLSVSVTAQGKMSDRELDGFKGKVKSVFSSYTYFENVDGKTTEKQSGVKFEKHYDENGNITQTLNYVVGDKNIYSFIEGEKTFKTLKIEGVGGSGSSNSNDAKKQKPRDDRYSIKYGYKYDKKDRVAEEILYSNDGSLISRNVYKYDEKGRISETERYNSDKISSRLTLKFDEKGNVIEDLLVYPNIKGEDGITRRALTDYKFDGQGNWVERTVTATYNRSGKTSIVKTIDHRTINYFEN